MPARLSANPTPRTPAAETCSQPARRARGAGCSRTGHGRTERLKLGWWEVLLEAVTPSDGGYEVARSVTHWQNEVPFQQVRRRVASNLRVGRQCCDWQRGASRSGLNGRVSGLLGGRWWQGQAQDSSEAEGAQAGCGRAVSGTVAARKREPPAPLRSRGVQPPLRVLDPATQRRQRTCATRPQRCSREGVLPSLRLPAPRTKGRLGC